MDCLLSKVMTPLSPVGATGAIRRVGEVERELVAAGVAARASRR